jgi:hypothetical protein
MTVPLRDALDLIGETKYRNVPDLRNPLPHFTTTCWPGAIAGQQCCFPRMQ